MPPSMITKYSEISTVELGVLQRQFKKSSFVQKGSKEYPKKLAIFDFDSTLFFSPLLSPTIWHPDLIKLATAESVYGPGWWRDIRSLDLGPIEELKKNKWKGYWNETIVQEARDCIADPNTMTVVLTGRRYHPFHQLIPDMLESKGLQFDLIGLRPDPESVSDNQWEATGGQKTKLSYNLTGSVFRSTMHFKLCFILNLLHNIPSINNIVMWDDRIHHVQRFREYLDMLRYSGAIYSGSVVYVPGIRPKYNPEWEKRVIGHIIETHNKALSEHVSEGKVNGKCEQRLEWKQCGKPEDPLDAASHHLLQLKSLPAQTVVALSSASIDELKKSYGPIYENQLQENMKGEWKTCGGEEPVYFGNYVYISQSVMPKDRIPFGSLGTRLGLIITDYSVSPKLPCLLLRVQVGSISQTKYILPLWYKPSEFIEIFRLKNVEWRSIDTTNTSLITSVHGVIDYAYRLGVLEKSLTYKRSREEDDDNSDNNRIAKRRPSRD